LDKEIKIKIKAYSLDYDRLKRKEEIIENNIMESRKVSRYLNRAKDDFLFATATKKLIENTKIRLELENSS